MGYRNLNELLSDKVRFGIVTLLRIFEGHGEVDFHFIKERLDLTDGNLASHIGKLKDAGFIEVNKQNIENRSHTTYSLTSLGRQTYDTHAAALEKLLKGELY